MTFVWPLSDPHQKRATKKVNPKQILLHLERKTQWQLDRIGANELKINDKLQERWKTIDTNKMNGEKCR